MNIGLNNPLLLRGLVFVLLVILLFIVTRKFIFGILFRRRESFEKYKENNNKK